MTATGAAVALQLAEPAILRVIKSRLNIELPGRNLIDFSSYDFLLQTTAAASGVLLALLFAALSTLAGALFNRLPSNLRSLLMYEEVSAFSLRLFAGITVFSWTALALRAVGYGRSYLVMLTLLFVVGPAIFSMTLVATRIFSLFDPTVLAEELVRRFWENVNAVQVGGHRWRDPAFQEFHRREALAALAGFETMVAFASHRKESMGDSLARLVRQVLGLAVPYIAARQRIPTASRWFEPRARYRRWTEASSAELHLSATTSSSLRPAIEGDPQWVERRLIELALRGYQTLLEQKRYPDARRLLSEMARTAAALGAEWELESSLDIASRAEMLTTEAARSADPGDMAGIRSVVDGVTTLRAGLLQGFLLSLADEDVTASVSKLRDGDWSGLVSGRLEGPIRAEVERLDRERRFERSVEGRSITPSWSAAEELSTFLANLIGQRMSTAIRAFREGTVTAAVRMKDVNATLGVIMTLNAIELGWKVGANAARAAVVQERLDSFRRVSAASPRWPKADWSDQIAGGVAELQVLLAQMLPLLSPIAEPSMPDFFGESLNKLLQGVEGAMTRGDVQQLDILFPAYFYGVLTTIQAMLANEGTARVAEDWILDLLHLSGLARAWSEFHRDGRSWRACRRVWDAYLLDGAPERCRLFVNLINAIRVTPRSALRMSWLMHLESAIRSLAKDTVFEPGVLTPDEIPVHPRALIRYLGRNRGSTGASGGDLFRDFYLRRHSACAGVAFGRRNLLEEVKTFAKRSRGER